MERSGDLVDGGVGCGQRQLGAFYPDEPNITANGDTHFLLEFPGKVVFGVSYLLCQFRKLQLLFRMKFNVVTTTANLCGNCRSEEHTSELQSL